MIILSCACPFRSQPQHDDLPHGAHTSRVRCWVFLRGCPSQLCDFGLARGLESTDSFDSFDESHNKPAKSQLPSHVHSPLKRALTKHVVTRWYRCVAVCVSRGYLASLASMFDTPLPGDVFLHPNPTVDAALLYLCVQCT